jgi:hypothetical protein
VRNDDATMTCGHCGTPFTPTGRRRWCSDACRQAAFRTRRAAPHPAQPAKADTVYECPSCETRYLGEQRCGDCNVFCRSLGAGGLCPHCDEPVAVADIVDASQLAPRPTRRRRWPR